jgi:iron(III) transport system permease protein
VVICQWSVVENAIMREPEKKDRVIQFAIATLMLAPLAAAFFGQGGFADAYGSYQSADPDAISARHWTLAAAAGRSLLVGGLATALALLVGIPAGWALAQRERPLWLLVLAALPLALPASVSVSGWIGLLAPAGVASRFKVPIPGFGPESRGGLFTVPGVAFVLGSSLWPLVAFEVWPAFRRARNEAYDAALLAGSCARAFFQIVLPQAKGELASGALLAFLLASTDFSVCSLLLVRTLPIEIHDALMVGKTASAAFAALPMLAMVFAIAWISTRLRRSTTVTGGVQTHARGGRLSQFSLLTGVALGFVIPMLVCFYQAQHGTKPMSQVFGAGSDSLLITARMAGAAALMAAIVAVLRLVFWPEMRTPAVTTAGLFLLAVPGSFLAAALLAMQIYATKQLNPDGSTPGQWTSALLTALPTSILAIGYLVRFMYVPLRLIEEGLASLDPDLLDAAALAGHGRISRAVSIALPLVAPHLAAATALVFILAMGEIPMAVRLAPPGQVPATVWLFQQQHLGYDEAVFGLSLLLGGVAAGTLLLCGLAAMGMMRWNDPAREARV